MLFIPFLQIVIHLVCGIPFNDGAAQWLNRILLISICIISYHGLAYLNTCLPKQRLYGAATINDQDTTHATQRALNAVWDTTIFCQVSS